ncbi:kinase-like protein [Ophiobolus disseminans]|uniref:non-specific serine/threonine protein kinase n=1 Tax=Ophiobolus disseminans TaxID=1469910 RepID=A0A6A7A152_9PLEO|nr:kinase-like protein [Ophiobolus disseminans]
MPASAPTKLLPKLRDQIQFQTSPSKQWIIISELGTKNGGGNAGIAKVEAKDDPYDRYFIEKRFLPEQIPWKVPHKEIALLHQLNDHPNILKLVDHFIDEAGKKASVYLEYCDAGDLETILAAAKNNNPVHERKIWKWFIGLIDALVYCHRGPKPEDEKAVLLYWNVIYHRDIKPPNIFLKTDRQRDEIVAKLADFGFSESVCMAYQHKKQADVAKSEAFTPGFEPPEHPEYTGATDVWQLALCMACVCTGNLAPWSKMNPTGKQWDRKQPAGRLYSRELNEMLRWCLDEDKARRPTPMQIAKRLKEVYEEVKYSLPPDLQPLVVPGRLDGNGAKKQGASSPGMRAGVNQLGGRDSRPGLHEHAFSDPEMQMMGRRDNRYDDVVQAQRSPMSPQSVADVINGGGKSLYGGGPRSGLLGGFTPGYGSHGYQSGGYPPGFGRGGYGGYGYDPRQDPRWRGY